jgi:hypothetical protein
VLDIVRKRIKGRFRRRGEEEKRRRGEEEKRRRGEEGSIRSACLTRKSPTHPDVSTSPPAMASALPSYHNAL